MVRTRTRLRIVLLSALAFGCVRRPAVPPDVSPGTPYVSWVIMSGDGDSPDRDFVCQSYPRTDCVIPASRLQNQVFSDAHVYYHAAGGETKYTGSFLIGYFQSTSAAKGVQANITVAKNESIGNQSVVGIVTSTPGEYEITLIR